MINKTRLIKLTRKLIRINSENPVGDESAIAGFVREYLSGFGVKAKIYEFKKRRSNILAVIKGRAGAKRSLLISPHLDTVPAGANWSTNAFSGQITGGRIYGLGATDCKGNLACAIEVINSLAENATELKYDLIFCATADEESGSELGLIPLLERGILSPDAALILDADEFDIVITQKGLMHLKVKLQGKRAHGAYPWQGTNAIDIALKILRELKGLRRTYPRNRYLRPPTMNIGTIHGGDKVNVVADWCEVELDFRFLPGQSARDILKDLKRVIRRHTSNFKLEIEGIQKPYYLSQDHRLILYLKSALRKYGFRPKIKGSEGATVATFFQNKRIPAVAIGFGVQGCAHSADEYARIEDLYKGALVLEEFLKSFRF